ncbi:MAG TPA: biopolymer transporter ExbD [Planctomycetota bacterium]|jgi:biopolymer transport protein ExbD|nr:biopolymer transporter ExbD [Planctomycetota bacterium]
MRFLNRRRQAHQQIDLNVIPLIDVVFFLLIFYVISTSFVQETAVSVQRPNSTQASTVSGGFVPVAIVKSGAIQVGPQVVDIAQVRDTVAAALTAGNTVKVLVIPDREVPTGLLLKVMDACSAAGAAQVDVAATKD